MQRLFAHTQRGQQITDPLPRATCHEIQDAVMQAGQTAFRQNRIGLCRERPVGKEKQLDGRMELGVTGIKIMVNHIDFYSVLTDIGQYT